VGRFNDRRLRLFPRWLLTDEEKASTLPLLLLDLEDDDSTVAVVATMKEERSCRLRRLGRCLGMMEGVDLCSVVVIFIIDWILERRRRNWKRS